MKNALKQLSASTVTTNNIFAILSQNCPRNDLRRPKIQNFSGGACPQTPLAARFACYSIPCHAHIFSAASVHPPFLIPGSAPAAKVNLHVSVHVHSLCTY